VLQERLADLAEACLLAHDGKRGYALTPLARRLLPALLALDAWAAEWAAALARAAQQPQSGR
jgi:DNA-binding HxlR family transcriptional regulator